MIVLTLISIAALVVVIDVVAKWCDKKESHWKCIIATIVGLLLIGGIVLQAVNTHKTDTELRQFRNASKANQAVLKAITTRTEGKVESLELTQVDARLSVKYVEKVAASTDTEHHYVIRVEPIAPKLCNNIWLEEKVYLVLTNNVYEAWDLPRFDFDLWFGSKTGMFDLSAPESVEIEREALQAKLMQRLHDQYGGDIVVGWLVRFDDGLTGQQRRQSWLFHSGFGAHRNLYPDTFTPLPDVVGGESLVERIHQYVERGPEQYVLFSPGYDTARVCTNLQEHAWVLSKSNTWRLVQAYFPEKTNKVVWLNQAGQGFAPVHTGEPTKSIRRVWYERDGKITRGTVFLARDGSISGTEDYVAIRSLGGSEMLFEGRMVSQAIHLAAVNIVKIVKESQSKVAK
ncbi:MAG: hypothetical protein KKB30_17190 [Proteobacteria bacterium]|nr:hypothetical protein [Pseudomonadota bacterium]